MTQNPAPGRYPAGGTWSSPRSHQLRLLRNLDLVDGQRHGRTIVYSLYDNHVAELIDQAIYHAEHLRLGAVDKGAEVQRDEVEHADAR